MKRLIPCIVAAAVVVAFLSSAAVTQAAPPKTGTDLMDYYDYELWVRDPSGKENNGEWYLHNTYDELGNAEFIAYWFEKYGLETGIIRVYIFGYPWSKYVF